MAAIAHKAQNHVDGVDFLHRVEVENGEGQEAVQDQQERVCGSEKYSWQQNSPQESAEPAADCSEAADQCQVLHVLDLQLGIALEVDCYHQTEISAYIDWAIPSRIMAKSTQNMGCLRPSLVLGHSFKLSLGSSSSSSLGSVL